MSVVRLIDNTDSVDFTINHCPVLDNLRLVVFLAPLDSK